MGTVPGTVPGVVSTATRKGSGKAALATASGRICGAKPAATRGRTPKSTCGAVCRPIRTGCCQAVLKAVADATPKVICGQVCGSTRKASSEASFRAPRTIPVQMLNHRTHRGQQRVSNGFRPWAHSALSASSAVNPVWEALSVFISVHRWFHWSEWAPDLLWFGAGRLDFRPSLNILHCLILCINQPVTSCLLWSWR